MKDITRKLVISLVILMAFAFMYVGVKVSWLAFLPACGMWILIGVVLLGEA